MLNYLEYNRFLRKLQVGSQLQGAEKNRELTVQRSEVVINAPIIVWNGLDGEPKILPNIDTIFQSIPDFSGEVVYVNTSSFKYHLILNTLV
jgi:hypothetical protein